MLTALLLQLLILLQIDVVAKIVDSNPWNFYTKNRSSSALWLFFRTFFAFLEAEWHRFLISILAWMFHFFLCVEWLQLSIVSFKSFHASFFISVVFICVKIQTRKEDFGFKNFALSFMYRFYILLGFFSFRILFPFWCWSLTIAWSIHRCRLMCCVCSSS